MSNFKFIPTENELKIIQEKIYNNESMLSIGRSINRSDKTVKKIIKEYNLDMSKYNSKKAHGKNIAKSLSDEEVSEILELLKKGYSIKSIVKNYDVSHPTLVKILQNKGIDHTKFKKVSSKKFCLSAEDIENVKEKLKNNITIKELSIEYNVNRNTFSEYLKSIGVVNAPSITNAEVENSIIEMHKDYLTLNQIHEITAVDTENINKIIDKSGINITDARKYKIHSRQDYKYKEIVIKHINLFYNKNNLEITVEDIEFCINNIYKIPFLEIVKMLNKDYKTLKKILILILGRDCFSFDKMYNSEFKDELLDDMSITKFSHSQLGMKYGVIGNTISTWRKKVYGDNFKTHYDTRLSKSTLELKFELILNSLKIAYVPQYRIGNYKYDYYLGHDILVELQGSIYHNKDEKEKHDIVITRGFSLIIVDEKDIDSKYTKQKILKIYLENIKKQYSI